MLLKGRYRIDRELGRGGFGTVYVAEDLELHHKRVVVKILRDHSDPWVQKKFRQEVEALARIDHPGVVGVLDHGETPDQKPYFVMQFIEGAPLRSAIERDGMAFPRAANILRRIGQALQAAHDRGVIHRDLKPENVMLQSFGDGEEHVRLIDFGIAGVLTSAASATGAETKVVGSMHYMAPEQFSGRPSSASDVYAFAVLAYEILTGRTPFSAESPAELLEQQRAESAAAPADLRPGIPPAVDRLILRALSFEPGARPASAREFGEQLAAALGVAGGKSPAASEPADRRSPLEMAYVLFMDLVAYSQLPMERQIDVTEELQAIVRGTAAFAAARRSNDLLTLPTGDGMALVFFRDPIAPVECAVQIARELRTRPHLRLRMGVHTGPVHRVADINANRNVTGGGINLAQRVMDCGDAGHILVSKAVADVLRQLGDWTGRLRDLGDVKIKHGELMRVFNVCTPEAGNAAVPTRVRKQRKIGARAAVFGFLLAGLAGGGFWALKQWTGEVAAPPKPVSKAQPEVQPSVKTPLGPPGGEQAAARTPPVSQPGARPAPIPARPRSFGEPAKHAAPTEPAAKLMPPESAPRPKVTPPVARPEWATYRGNFQRTGIAGVIGPRRAKVAWVAELSGQLRSSPAVGAGGTVYQASTDRNLYAVRDGRVLWTAPIGAVLQPSPYLLPDGTIRVRNASGDFAYLDPDGGSAAPNGAAPPDHAAQSPDGRSIYIAEGSTLRLAADGGWKFDLEQPASTSPAVSSNGDVYIGSSDGTVYCIDRHGRMRWTYRAAVKVTTPPALKDDGDVYFGCFDRNLYCVRDGQLRWKFRTGGPIFSAPVVDRSGTVYFGSNDAHLYAVNDRGEEVWKLSLGNEIHASPAFDQKGRLYVPAIQRRLYCITE